MPAKKKTAKPKQKMSDDRKPKADKEITAEELRRLGMKPEKKKKQVVKEEERSESLDAYD